MRHHLLSSTDLRASAARIATVAFIAASIAPASAASILRVPALSAPRAVTQAAQRLSPGTITFTFITLDDQADPTFNQLLGINDHGKIAGYFGSGMPGHPNKGYVLLPPYGQNNYVNENFPGSAQTQVTAINNRQDTAGFWVNAKNQNFGFIRWHGVYTSYRDPHTGKGTVNQLLGLNNAGIAVGFYTDANNVNHAYELDQSTGHFTAIVPPGGTNATASGLNQAGDVTGFFTNGSGAVVGWLLKGNTFIDFSFPGATSTMPFGINNKDQIVGEYMDSAGTHGFLLSNPLGPRVRWQSIDDPNGIGTTVVNGINDKTQLVGFYVDASGNTNGMLANPSI